MRKIIAATFFRTIQAILFPSGAVAYLPFVVKLIRYSRRSGTSATVLASFYTRYMQHKLGTRPDEPCERLMLALPSVSRLGLRLETLRHSSSPAAFHSRNSATSDRRRTASGPWQASPPRSSLLEETVSNSQPGRPKARSNGSGPQPDSVRPGESFGERSVRDDRASRGDISESAA